MVGYADLETSTCLSAGAGTSAREAADDVSVSAAQHQPSAEPATKPVTGKRKAPATASSGKKAADGGGKKAKQQQTDTSQRSITAFFSRSPSGKAAAPIPAQHRQPPEPTPADAVTADVQTPRAAAKPGVPAVVKQELPDEVKCEALTEQLSQVGVRCCGHIDSTPSAAGGASRPHSSMIGWALIILLRPQDAHATPADSAATKADPQNPASAAETHDADRGRDTTPAAKQDIAVVSAADGGGGDKPQGGGAALRKPRPDALLLSFSDYKPVEHAVWEAGQLTPYLHLAQAFQVRTVAAVFGNPCAPLVQHGKTWQPGWVHGSSIVDLLVRYMRHPLRCAATYVPPTSARGHTACGAYEAKLPCLCVLLCGRQWRAQRSA